jgi:hypothetical protein
MEIEAMNSVDRTRARPALRVLGASLMVGAIYALAPTASAQPTTDATALAGPSYADFADLAEAAGLVALVTVRDQVAVESERSPGLAAGQVRLYIEARTEALLAGRSAVGESLAYLVDVPLTAKGKAPKLKKQRFLIFARAVPGRPGELMLVDRRAQIPATPESEQLARAVIAALAAPDAPPRVSGIREVMSVAGNLAGESETQLFLNTASGTPVSVTVVRRPGMDPQWGVSWSEIVDQAARPPAPGTVEWYRLACFLPLTLPADAYLQSDRAGRARAEADYRFVLDQLGACPRTRT